MGFKQPITKVKGNKSDKTDLDHLLFPLSLSSDLLLGFFQNTSTSVTCAYCVCAGKAFVSAMESSSLLLLIGLTTT